MKSIVCLLFLIFSACNSFAGEKMVFAHYMVCCSFAGNDVTIEDYEKEIKLAKSLGIDGFALNVGQWSKQGYRERVMKLYEAAEAIPDFKLFISLDQHAFDEVEDIVRETSNKPTQFRFKNMPVLSTFGGQGANGRSVNFSARMKKLGVFFIPYFYPYPELEETPGEKVVKRTVSDHEFLDGFFYFGTAGIQEDLIKTTNYYNAAWHSLGKIFMAGISPYYRGSGSNFRVFDGKGLLAMDRQWRNAISEGIDWIEIITWNDWEESSYVAPFGDIYSTRLWRGHYGDMMLSHDGFLKSLKFYISWFKTGNPPRLEHDSILYFYRLHSISVPASISPRHADLGFPRGIEELHDDLYFSVFLTAKSDLSICFGSLCETREYDAGVTHDSISLKNGYPYFLLTRNGSVIFEKKAEFPYDAKDSISRFNYFSGGIGFD